MTHEQRVAELIGAKVVGIKVDPDFTTLFLEHRGCDDDAADVLVRTPDIAFRYPIASSGSEGSDPA